MRQSTVSSAASNSAGGTAAQLSEPVPACDRTCSCAVPDPLPPQAHSRRAAAPTGGRLGEDDPDVVGQLTRGADQLHDARIAGPGQGRSMRRNARRAAPPRPSRRCRRRRSPVRPHVSSAISASSTAPSRAAMPSRWLAGHQRRIQCPSASRRSWSTDPGSTPTPFTSIVCASSGGRPSTAAATAR